MNKCLHRMGISLPGPAYQSQRPSTAPQYSSLEPEVVCRLVYVKDVQMSQTQAAPGAAAAVAAASAAAPPAGATELPSCPVCLERLDEHISGIVTTVSRADVVLYAV